MIVVFDTSCISAFIRINRIELLIKILKSHQIVITEQVSRELKLSKLDSLRNFGHPKIEIKVADSNIAEHHHIHIGEASVIMFAKENNALAIIDDKKAREAAEQEGANYIGTATLLKLAKENGIVKKDEIKNLLEQITMIGKLYLSEEIVAWVLE